MRNSRTGLARAFGAGLAGSSIVLTGLATLHLVVRQVPFGPTRMAQDIVRLVPGAWAVFFINHFGHWAQRLTVLGAGVAFLLIPAAGAALPFVLGLPARVGVTSAMLALWLVEAALFVPEPQDAGRILFALVTLPIFLGGAAAAVILHQRLMRPVSKEGSREPDAVRRVLLRASLAGAGALVLGWTDLGLRSIQQGRSGRIPLSLPSLGSRVSLPPSGSRRLEIAGLTPEITPIGDFYVVDQAIENPVLDAGSWRLSVEGSIRRPYHLTYAQLKALPTVERYQTLECVGNPVGGNLISTTRWEGVPLRGLLDRADVSPGAVEVAFIGADGYSDSLPLAQAFDESTLIVLGMNGLALQEVHGFPARLLSIGTYGFKNVKWLTGVRAVDTHDTGFWEERGWSASGTVKTEARIDVPTMGLVVRRPIPVAGIAFAGDRGISRVEVSTNAGRTWAAADLEPALSPLTWRRWRFDWRPSSSGRTAVMARAYDGGGAPQTSAFSSPEPSGASGYPTVWVTVELAES